MKCEVINMRLVKNSESARKAYCSVIIEDSVVLNDIAIVQGKRGFFPSMPQKSYESGGETKYTNIYNPITKEARDLINDEILKVFYERLKEENT